MKKTNLILLLPLALLLSAWGYKGHRIISGNVAVCVPQQTGFLKPAWTNFITNHASDPDNRRDTDPNEAPRHYIDIDNYPEFIATGRIPQTYDSVTIAHGTGWVIDQGILPWATLRTYDSLKSAFSRGDWNASAQFAADLGHYVADGHMPLHLTANYDGQQTGQSGIHSRYESKMVSQFEGALIYPADSVRAIGNVEGYVFSYIYANYHYVDSVLLADTYAKAQSGGAVTGNTYYQALWQKTGNFTIGLFRGATLATASLIYTAWVEAGSPVFYPAAMTEMEDIARPRLLGNFPNPFNETTTLKLEVPVGNTQVDLLIYDEAGKLRDTLFTGVMEEGLHRIRWEASGLNSGVYMCILKSGNFSATHKMVLVK